MIYFLATVILLIVAVWNGYVILWKTEPEPDSHKYSKIWHKIGLGMRVLIYFIPFSQFTNIGEAIRWTALFMSIGGVAYDFIINLIRFLHTGKPDLWYVDNKGWNKAFMTYILIPCNWIIKKFKLKQDDWLLASKVYWALRGVFVVATIILFLI